MRSRVVSLPRIGRSTMLMVVATVVAALGTGLGHAPSVLLGGAFMLADFYLLRMLVSRLMKPGVSQAVSVALLTLKFFLVVGLIAGALYQLPVAPLSFAVGASLLLVAAVLDAVWLGEPVPEPE